MMHENAVLRLPLIVFCNLFFFILILETLYSPMTYSKSDNNMTAVSPDSPPYAGLTLADWTSKWWQWFISMKDDNNHPFNDPTGANCTRHQEGPVWFLVGSNGHAVRTCAIPHGKAILLPTINNECSTAEDPTLKNEQDLRSCAISNASYFKNFEFTIDGVPLKGMEKYNVVSPLFNVIFPSDHPMFTARPGPSQSVSAGNWVLLPPLPPGPHEIHFKGQSVDFTGVATHNFAQDGIYHLLVK
jgi:hypothetical protein